MIYFLAKDERHATELAIHFCLEYYPNEKFTDHHYLVGTPVPDEVFEKDERYLSLINRLNTIRDWYYLGFPDAGKDDLEKALGIKQL